MAETGDGLVTGAGELDWGAVGACLFSGFGDTAPGVVSERFSGPGEAAAAPAILGTKVGAEGVGIDGFEVGVSSLPSCGFWVVETGVICGVFSGFIVSFYSGAANSPDRARKGDRGGGKLGVPRGARDSQL